MHTCARAHARTHTHTHTLCSSVGECAPQLGVSRSEVLWLGYRAFYKMLRRRRWLSDVAARLQCDAADPQFWPMARALLAVVAASNCRPFEQMIF